MSPELHPDQAAAHELLSELRTRITTQPLPYQHGDEKRALESLWEVFGHARQAMKGHPGCDGFARLTTTMLNRDLRPVTARWHRAALDGRLASKDGADAFRGDLAAAQERLRAFALQLQEMAYGHSEPDVLTPPAVSNLDGLFTPALPFGICGGPAVDNAAKINADEARCVEARRAYLSGPSRSAPGTDAVGLALSGGGLRSATFSLGVVQVLADRGLLPDVDFLSTVSGGAYTGSFLSQVLSGADGADRVVGRPHGPDPAPIAALRARAKYLPITGAWSAWVTLVTSVIGMILNWTVPLCVVATLALGAAFARQAPTLEACRDRAPLGLAVVSGVLLVLYGLVLRHPRMRRHVGSAIAGTAALATVGAAWAAATHLVTAAPAWVGDRATLMSLAAGLAVAGPAALPYVPLVRDPKVRGFLTRALLTGTALVVPVAAVAVFEGILWLVNHADPVVVGAYSVPWWPIVLAADASALALAVGFLDVNETGPHRLFRDALARTFLSDARVSLKDLDPSGRAPYHLVNATVNLPSATDPSLHERRGDFFVFSRHWCGSPATRYRPTEEWTIQGRPMDLATAMAVSGAAASTHMGLASIPALTALMAFLNVRFGYWICNLPGGAHRRAPGFMCLLREMTGWGMSPRAAWLNLSDGGHLENMGAYELLRRRCRFVIVVDGERDPGFQFDGLLTLVRHAQIDLGVQIDVHLADLRPHQTTGLSPRHAVFSRIDYPAVNDQPAATGLLLYLKLSVTGNETELIRHYRDAHAAFPHEPTVDHVFDQEQFEAYRELGVHVAEGLFSKALVGDTPPATVRDWFRHLATNLLDVPGA